MKLIKANKLLVRKGEGSYYNNWEIIDPRWFNNSDKVIRWDGFYISSIYNDYYKTIGFLDKHKIKYNIVKNIYILKLFIPHNSLYEIN